LRARDIIMGTFVIVRIFICFVIYFSDWLCCFSDFGCHVILVGCQPNYH
jgi:hypothetical protein